MPVIQVRFTCDQCGHPGTAPVSIPDQASGDLRLREQTKYPQVVTVRCQKCQAQNTVYADQ